MTPATVPPNRAAVFVLSTTFRFFCSTYEPTVTAIRGTRKAQRKWPLHHAAKKTGCSMCMLTTNFTHMKAKMLVEMTAQDDKNMCHGPSLNQGTRWIGTANMPPSV